MRLINQSIWGAGAALIAGSAAAQFSVTLYGASDVSFQYLDDGGKHSYSERSSGNTGSMFDLKGGEDLATASRRCSTSKTVSTSITASSSRIAPRSSTGRPRIGSELSKYVKH